MKSSAYSRDNNLQIKVPTNEGDIITIKTVQQKMKDYLLTLDFTASQKIDSITSLPKLITYFAQIVKQLSNSKLTNIPQSALQTQLTFYKERDANHQKTIKSIKEQVLTYMKNVSHKQAEIDKYEAQIFKLKQTLQQKQKTMLSVLLQNKQKPKISNSQNPPSRQKSAKKIVRRSQNQNNREIDRQPSSKIRKDSAKPHQSRERESWQLQKDRLLKVIRDKDLKIYELIQQLKQKK